MVCSARLRFGSFALGVVLGGVAPAKAQCLDWQGGFQAPGTNNSVTALVTFDDGSGTALYAGGAFTSAGGTPASYIARWDGASWSTVGGGVSASVGDLIVFDDGSGPALYASGLFTTAGGNPANHIAKWDGTSWTALGSGLNNSSSALAVFDDGSGPALYAGGNFTTAGGISANHIAKWDGVSWSPLGSGLSDSRDGLAGVFALEVFDDGTGPALYTGGEFSGAGGFAAPEIAKWDGASWSAVGGGVDHLDPDINAMVSALKVFDDGTGPALYAGGNFSHAGGIGSGIEANRVARWNGASWSALDSGVNASINDFGVFDDGSGSALYAGGPITTAGGAPVNHVAKWDGTSWSSLNGGVDSSVLAFEVFDDGSGPALYTGGSFSIVEGAVFNHVASWDGASWSPLSAGNGMNGTVLTLAALNDGNGPDLYAGGEFSEAGGEPFSYVARWDGSNWSPLGEGLNDFVNALAAFDDGTGPAIYAGGRFTETGQGGIQANHVARWDGASWSPLDSGLDHWVEALTVFDDGSGPALYAGGLFTSAGGTAANRVAKWDGTGWSALGSGVDQTVYALIVHDDGSGSALFAGGDFHMAGGAPAERIARWNGSSWLPLGLGMGGGGVRALAAFDDGSGLGPALYAGGGFTTAGGLSALRIAKWDGVAWSALGGGMSASVQALAVHHEGSGGFPSLFAGGTFRFADGMSVERVARWDGSTWSALGGGVDERVDSIALFDDGSGAALYIGGDMTTADGTISERIAKWEDPCISCSSTQEPYCVGEINSLGCVSFITATGTASVSGLTPFTVQGLNTIPGQFGFLLYSLKKANLGFHGGTLCVKSPFVRWLPPKQASSSGTGTCPGILTRNFNNRIQSGTDATLTAGQSVSAQWFQRDPSDPGGFAENLTNAVRFVICP